MNKKVADSVQKTEINGRGIRCADHVTPLHPQKLALTSPTGGGRSVGIVRSRTKAMEFSLLYDMIYICQLQLGSHQVAVVWYTFTHKQYIEQQK